MRYKLNLQVGVYHKPKDNPDADFIKLGTTPLKDLLYEAMENINFNFEVKDILKMADGSTFLVEFESIVDVDPKGETSEINNQSN
jgi:hypothetical protein